MAERYSPECPGCGYPILGLRDMVCPECGRKVDVRDFNFDDARGQSQKYERDSAIAGGIGIVMLLVLLAPLVLATTFMARFGLIPACLVIAVGMVVVALIGVSGHTGRSLRSWFKGRR